MKKFFSLFDEEFFKIQDFIHQLNEETTVLDLPSVKSQEDLVTQLIEQTKVYGQKIIDLYETIDGLQRPDAREYGTALASDVSQQQIVDRLEEYFSEGGDHIKGCELLESLDYQLPLPPGGSAKNALHWLEVSNRVKDHLVREIRKSLVPQEGNQQHQLQQQHQPVYFFENLDALKQTLEQLLQTQRSDSNKFLGKIEYLEGKLQECVDEIGRRDQAITERERDLSACLAQIELKDTNLRNFCAELEEVKNRLKEQETRHQEDLRSFDQTERELSQAKEELRRIRDHEQLKSYAQELQHIKLKHKQLTLELQKEQLKNSELLQRIDSTQSLKDGVALQDEAAAEENLRQMSENLELKGKLAVYESEVRELHSSLTSLREERESDRRQQAEREQMLQQELQQLQEKLKNKTQELKYLFKSEESHCSSCHSSGEKKAQGGATQDSVQELETRCRMLENQVNVVIDQNKNLQELNQRIENQFQQVQNELLLANKELEVAQQSSAVYARECEKARLALQKRDTESIKQLETLRQKCSSQEEEIKRSHTLTEESIQLTMQKFEQFKSMHLEKLRQAHSVFDEQRSLIIKTKDLEIAELQEKVNQTLALTETQRDQHDQKLKALEKQNENKLDTANQTIDKLQKKIERQRDSVKQMRAEFKAISLRIRQLEQELVLRETENSELRLKLFQAGSENKAAMQSTGKKMTSLGVYPTQKFTSRTQSVEKTLRESSSPDSCLNEKDENIDIIKKEYQGIIEVNELLQTENTNLKQQLEQSHKKIGAASAGKSLHKKQNSDNAKIKKEIQRAQQKIADLQSIVGKIIPQVREYLNCLEILHQITLLFIQNKLNVKQVQNNAQRQDDQQVKRVL